MFVLRPSSPFKTAPLIRPEISEVATPSLAEPQGTAAPAVDAEPFIDLGLPVPDTYDTDILRAMIQDPFRVFIYWEAREENLRALTDYFSAEEVKTFSTVLKLRDLATGHEAYFPVGRRGRYWMMVFPDREYEFEIGVRSSAHGYISLLRSNRVRTPRGTISPVTADEAEYRLEPMDFLNVIEKSGFGAEQALDIKVAAMPGTELGEDLLEETFGRLPADVRGAVETAVEGGQLTAAMISELPESMRGLLERLLHESGGEVASAALMHYLPELLREAIEDEREWVADQTHPLHLSPRFFVGASETAQFPFGEVLLPRPRRLRPSSDEKYQNPNASSGPSLRRLFTEPS